jgi:hypothetical protein
LFILYVVLTDVLVVVVAGMLVLSTLRLFIHHPWCLLLSHLHILSVVLPGVVAAVVAGMLVLSTPHVFFLHLSQTCKTGGI